jgi:two-component system, sensor histidine kinase and response regulator
METIDSQAPVILIVDDNPENIQVLGKLLKDKKYIVEFAIEGESALKWIMKREFDLILLDINMPGMSGFDVCKKIRSDPKMKHLPVIFLSAESDRESILTGFELGGQDYITKPFDGRELLVRVKTHITLKRSLEKLESVNQYLEEKVTERTVQLKESNEMLEAANLKLIDLDNTKTEFLNLISHEIRTPLNGIMGPLQLLKEPVSSNELTELLDVLDISVKRLEKFALNALLITKLRTRRDISKNSIQLQDLISKVTIENNDKAKEKNLQFNFITTTDPIFISGDVNLIKTCIINVIDNAIRYSPKDNIIEIKCNTEERNIICEIRDHGKGFSREIIEKPFELFITDKEYGDNQIGLDLPIVKMIMEAHGGNVKLYNDPMGGAVVRLEFIKDL